jgi:hypothetical protein
LFFLILWNEIKLVVVGLELLVVTWDRSFVDTIVSLRSSTAIARPSSSTATATSLEMSVWALFQVEDDTHSLTATLTHYKTGGWEE